MIYKIKFISEEVDGFFREIEIDSEANFLDLSNAILKSCGYPDNQMTSFYTCNDEWERGSQITREDVSDPTDEEEDIYLMEKTPLSDFIDDEGQRFEYIFDPFTERSFYLQVKAIVPGRHLKTAEVVREQGEPPVQIQELDLDPVAPAKGKKVESPAEDDDELFYSDGGGFNDDELDLDGFEISEGRPY